MKFDPPRLSRGPLSGRIYVVTHGSIMGHDEEGREKIEATRKYDVTDQFASLVMNDEAIERAAERLDERTNGKERAARDPDGPAREYWRDTARIVLGQVV